MAETIAGGRYVGEDGCLHDAQGRLLPEDGEGRGARGEDAPEPMIEPVPAVEPEPKKRGRK